MPAVEGELVELPVAFGDELVVYELGPAAVRSAGAPGRARRALRATGRLPWKRLVEPALALARTGVPLPEMHERSLAMLGDVFSPRARQ